MCLLLPQMNVITTTGIVIYKVNDMTSQQCHITYVTLLVSEILSSLYFYKSTNLVYLLLYTFYITASKGCAAIILPMVSGRIGGQPAGRKKCELYLETIRCGS